jgi:hypothetical protein
MIESSKGHRFCPMGLHVRIPLDYDIDQLATRLRRKAEVHVCSRDFPRDAIVLLVIDCRAPDRGRRLSVFARTAEELFSGQAASAVSARLSDTQRGWRIS